MAREVGTEGQLGGQAEVQGVSGTWKDLTQSVNFMANNLTIQVRNIADVTTAVAKGDLSKKITVDAKGEILELVTTVNTMVDQLSSFAEQVTRVAREVGTEGILGGQAHASGVTGIWKDLTDNVNLMAKNLTMQVRNISQVAAAVANGDLTQKVTIEARGEVAQLADTFNTMVKTLSLVRRAGHQGGPRGGHGRHPGRAGACAGRGGHVEGPHRLGERHGVQPDRPGAQHRHGHHGHRQGRPDEEDRHRRARRDPRAEDHHQHDGRPAVVVRRGGHPGRPRGGHRGAAGRPGTRAWTSPAPGAT